MGGEKRTGGDEKCAGPGLNKVSKGCVDLGLGAGIEDKQLYPERVRGLLRVVDCVSALFGFTSNAITAA